MIQQKLVPQLRHFKNNPQNEAEVRDLLMHLWKYIFSDYIYLEGFSDRSPDIVVENKSGEKSEGKRDRILPFSRIR